MKTGVLFGSQRPLIFNGRPVGAHWGLRALRWARDWGAAEPRLCQVDPRVVQKMGVPLVWGKPLTYMWMMLLDSHGMFGWKWHEMIIFDIVDCVKS